MKKIIFFLLISSAVNVHAQFSTEDDPTRSVSDLMYLPEAGTWFVSVDGGKTSTDSTLTLLNTGAVFASSDKDSTDTNIELGTVIDGDMLVSLKVPYLLKSEDSTTYGPASTSNGTTETTESKGLGDLELDFKWRVMDQAKKSASVDLKLNFSPKTGDNELASQTKNGNNYRGGTSYGIGVEVGKKLKSIQFSGGLDIDFTGSREAKYLSDNTKISIDSLTSFVLSGLVQLQPNEKFFLNFGLSFHNIGDFSSNSSGTKTDYSTDPFLQLGVAAGYKFSESVALRLLYTTASYDRTITQGAVIIEDETDLSSLKGILQVQF